MFSGDLFGSWFKSTVVCDPQLKAASCDTPRIKRRVPVGMFIDAAAALDGVERCYCAAADHGASAFLPAAAARICELQRRYPTLWWSRGSSDSESGALWNRIGMIVYASGLQIYEERTCVARTHTH